MHAVVRRHGWRIVGATGLAVIVAAAVMGSCGGGSPATPADGVAEAGTDQYPDRTDVGTTDVATDSSDVQVEAATDGPSETLPPDQAWLADPGIWAPVDDPWWAPNCTVLEAAPGKLHFPTLEWTSCGDGCDYADVVQGYGPMAGMAVASTELLGGKLRPYLTAQGFLKTTNTTYLFQRLIQLDDGESVAALELRESASAEYASCDMGRSAESALLAFTWVHDADGGSIELNGSWQPKDTVTWRRPWLSLSDTPAARMTFDIEDQRRAFYVGFNAVRVQDSPASSAFTTLESPSGSLIGAGQGDLAAWTDYALAGNPRIRGWAPDGKGVRTIVDGLAEETCELAVTPTDIVGWMGVEMSDFYCASDFSSAHLWRTPRAYDTAGVQLSVSPELPGKPFGANLRAWGDFAALAVQPIQPATDGGGPTLGEAYVLVVRLSTWKMWRIDMPAGWMLHGNAFTLSPTYLYVGEHDATETMVPDSIHRMVRFDLTKLDQVATAL